MDFLEFKDKKGILLSKELLYLIEPQKDNSIKKNATKFLFKGYISNKPRAYFTPSSSDTSEEYLLTREETASQVQSLEGKIIQIN